jgi:hypothetical protein
MPARGHNRVLLGGLGLFLALVVWLALTLEPIDGDLVRVGGLFERDWGWQGTHPRYREPLHRYPDSDADRPLADIVVFGDSFSHQAHRGYEWQAVLAARTGARIVTYDLRRFEPLAVLESAEYRRHPPAAVVYQSSELSLADRLPRYARDCASGVAVPQPGRSRRPLPVRPLSAEQMMAARVRGYGWDLSARVDAAMHVLRLGLEHVGGASNVRVLPLARRGLFSSRRDDLLVYGYAVRPRLSRRLIERMGCGLASLQRRVEQQVGAVFVPLLVPNKYSAYQRYLKSDSDADPGFVADVFNASGLPPVGLASALEAAIAAGEQDVYLPNDSHWGPIGHQLAADVVLRALLARGVLDVQGRLSLP